MDAQILLADAPNAWHATLLTALGEDAAKVKQSSSGTELQSSLVDPRWKVILVGDGLTELSHFDALYQSSREPKLSKDKKRTGPIVLMLIDVRHDLELLTLLRSRGVSGFVCRDAPMDEIVARIRSCFYVDSRVARREFINTKGSVEVDKERVSIVVEDLSTGGALFIGSARKLQPVGKVGGELLLEIRAHDISVVVRVVIRRIDLRKGLLGDRLALGVSFAEPDIEQSKAVETILERAATARERNDIVNAMTFPMGTWRGE